jgi:hypothetical protein
METVRGTICILFEHVMARSEQRCTERAGLALA